MQQHRLLNATGQIKDSSRSLAIIIFNIDSHNGAKDKARGSLNNRSYGRKLISLQLQLSLLGSNFFKI
jgi:hypothetical protein